MSRNRQRAFTLLELLLVILITGVIAVVVAPVIHEPVRAYFDQAPRAALVDAADAALRRIARDLRNALPYSTRINAGGNAVEIIGVLDGGRYRDSGGPPDGRLQFGTDDNSFNLLGRFERFGTGTLGGNQRLVIFNLGMTDFDAYQDDPVITPAGTAINISDDGGEHNITLNPAHEFPAQSPSRRVYIANGGTSYACTNGGLFRWSGYGYLADQPTPGDIESNGVLVVNNVTGCRFDHDPGNASRPELMIMSIEISRDGESVTLLHQVHIDNAT